MKDLREQHSPKNDSEVKEISEASLGFIYREITVASYEYHSPTKINYFLLMLFERGNIKTTYSKDRHIAPYQMQLCFPGQELHCKLESTTILHEISVSLETFHAVLSNFKYPLFLHKKYPSVTLDKETFFKLINELKSIHLEIKLSNRSSDVIYARLRIILLIINRELLKVIPQPHGNHNQISVLEKFTELVYKHCQETRSVKFYADQLFMSANYLNILCKKHYKKTASNIIASELLEVIKCLLGSKEKSINSISSELKFSDTASFSNFFKKHTGMSPKMFREQMLTSC